MAVTVLGSRLSAARGKTTQDILDSVPQSGIQRPKLVLLDCSRASGSNCWFCPSLSDLPQFAYPAHLDPLHNIDIAFVIEARAVGANKLAGGEVISRELASGHVIA